jgi:haloacetate dehalogenase
MFDGFEGGEIATADTTIFARWSGSGPPLLLLHGFPETHLMWLEIAPLLARRCTVVCADLRGYGRSGCPPSDPTHGPYSKRAMARDMVEVMERLGFRQFAVAGHDRGGRVAYRLSLDHADRVTALAVLDVLPTAAAWERADARFALGYWPWSLLAQPEPLPERMLMTAADAVVEHALGAWGTAASVFDPARRAAYVEVLRNPAHVHAICEEYRAAATTDRAHDEEDRAAGRRIGCPVLVVWSRSGPLGSWYTDVGGPLGIWRQWAADVRGSAVDAGHFFPEEAPMLTARALEELLSWLR